MSKGLTIKYALVILLLIETLCVTYVLKIPSLIPVASIVYFISGVFIPLLFIQLPTVKIRSGGLWNLMWSKLPYKLVLVFSMAFAVYHFTSILILKFPLSIYAGDMLPIMKVMAQRFVNGEWTSVYQPITEIWDGIQPIYLPAMWGPFTLAILGNFDLRWITAAGLVLAFTFVLFLWQPAKKKILNSLLLTATGITLWWLLTEPIHNFIRLSEEGVVVFYYSLLVLSLLSENFILIGISAAFCALSRYWLIGWFPAMVIYLILIRKDWKKLLLFLSVGIFSGLLFVILPFGIRPVQITLDLPHQYIKHASRVWSENPEFFRQSMGAAKFFGPGRTELLHKLLLFTAMFIPMIFMMGCFIWEKIAQKKLANIPLACLKLTLVFAIVFIDVPYLYLFYTSSIVSLLMIVAGINNDSMVKTELFKK